MMGGLAKKPNKPKPQPVMPAPDLLTLEKARSRRAAQYAGGSTIMSNPLGG